MPFSFLRKNSFKIHLSDEIEVSINAQGPYLAFSCVLSADKDVVFVQKISVNLQSKQTEEQHLFEWFALRPHQFQGGTFRQIDFKMPSKFMVTGGHPYEYNILFVDQIGFSHMKPVLQALRRNWQAFLGNIPFEEVVPKYADLFLEFKEKKETKCLLRELQDCQYWQKGDYAVTMIVTPKDGTIPWQVKKTFSLQPEHEQILQQNLDSLLLDICRQPGAKFEIATTPLF